MPSATTDKLTQLRSQLQDCTNPTAAKLLKSTIAKLESQLNPAQPKPEQPKAKSSQTKSSTIAQRKAALKESQKQTNRKISQQQQTKLKPPAQNQAKPKADATPQQNKSTSPTQESPKAQTEATPQSKNPNPATQTQAKATPKEATQLQTAEQAPAPSKSSDCPWEPRLLPGNGTHRAWCRIPGTIRMQEAATEDEQPQYFLQVEGHLVPLRVKRDTIKWVKRTLDKRLMVIGYPQILEGQIKWLQCCGAYEQSADNPERWVMVGVWNGKWQKIMVQRDQTCDPTTRILYPSPLVIEECLAQLKGGKLYEYECQREGITVTVVGVEAKSVDAA